MYVNEGSVIGVLTTGTVVVVATNVAASPVVVTAAAGGAATVDTGGLTGLGFRITVNEGNVIGVLA